MAQASGSRAGLMYQIYGMQCLNRLGRILIRINEAEMTTERHLPQINGDFQVVQPATINGGSNLDMEVRIDIAETEPENRLFKRKEYMEGLQIVGALYGPGHPMTNRLMSGLAETFKFENAEAMAAAPPVAPPAPPGAQPPGPGAPAPADRISAQAGAAGIGPGVG